jgi:tRNA 2-selenouridine synthase
LAEADPSVLAGFDAVIDVRSPSEFAEDHVPGAINLPVLDDDQRVKVGTLYARSRFEARRLGAAIVARNIAAHLEGALAGRASSFKPLIYCWRGGMRSHAMATVLSQVGWRTALLAGGYRTWRRHVQERLYGDGDGPDLVLIDGDTGTGKTELLARLAARGLQVLDLEGLAEHRGSLFGGFGGRPQLSQKAFESRLLDALNALDLTHPVVAEAESSKIGDRMVPPLIWRAMQTAPRVRLSGSLEARARYLVTAYRDIVEDRATLEEAFSRLPIYPSRKLLANWRGMADAGDFTALATALIELHYDPAYARSAKRETRALLGAVEVGDLGSAAQEATADAVARLVRRAGRPQRAKRPLAGSDAGRG